MKAPVVQFFIILLWWFPFWPILVSECAVQTPYIWKQCVDAYECTSVSVKEKMLIYNISPFWELHTAGFEVFTIVLNCGKCYKKKWRQTFNGHVCKLCWSKLGWYSISSTLARSRIAHLCKTKHFSSSHYTAASWQLCLHLLASLGLMISHFFDKRHQYLCCRNVSVKINVWLCD